MQRHQKQAPSSRAKFSTLFLQRKNETERENENEKNTNCLGRAQSASPPEGFEPGHSEEVVLHFSQARLPVLSPLGASWPWLLTQS